MRIRSMFHILAVLMVVLIFGMPFAALAQQKSVQTEVSEAAAEQDKNAMILEIKAAAEQDASNDINRWGWFGAGLGMAYAGGVGGGFAGCIINESTKIRSSYFSTGPTPEQANGFLAGATMGVLLSIISIYASPAHMPAGRLTGKSPEYVEFYTDAYQRKMRSLKTKWAAAGAATGCGVPIFGCLLIQFLNPPPEDDPYD